MEGGFTPFLLYWYVRGIMTLLTSKDKEFLQKHKISIGSVFDATGLGKKDYRVIMKSLNKTIAIGVTPCRRYGHQLRSRSGHCVQCNTANLAFQNRFSENGYVYIAGSQSLKLIKVGFASDFAQRMTTLNSLGYGGVNDWEILYWVNTQDAGQIEYEVHVSLREFASPTSYIRGNDEVDCLETFSCNIHVAIKAIKTLTSSDAKCWSNTAKLDQYDIKSRSGDNFVRKGFVDDGEKPKTLSRPPITKPTSENTKLDEFTNKTNDNSKMPLTEEMRTLILASAAKEEAAEEAEWRARDEEFDRKEAEEERVQAAEQRVYLQKQLDHNGGLTDKERDNRQDTRNKLWGQILMWVIGLGFVIYTTYNVFKYGE
jgi:hypothetical protein